MPTTRRRSTPARAKKAAKTAAFGWPGLKPGSTDALLRVNRQWAEMWMAVPQVVTHRVGRMATAGPNPSAKDRREFHRMGAEKVQAFQKSWMGMGAAFWRLQQQWLWRAWQHSFTWPLSLLGGMGKARPWSDTSGLNRLAADGAARVLGHGLRPVHRRATANARRLGRRR